ncbi:helix-turn-helix domain-containing protein [Arsenicicoccus sp. oral taxon 190]|uniref:helix-turn-helix domain-containing protein n=1 Tax=Arsenicicoccus sp. oral taxon 190 TaxID=1658671 RepID=UPI00067A403D|nr:helix-turn-helix transcriptional regulator [Arsenicicoccus sp. oral taxon 190]AKT50173.1 AraC family transcriptional regulator [Arsenicicoccus sp. oral taxon 190]
MGGLEDSRQPGRAPDDIERAHLRDPSDDTFEISRHLPPDELTGWIRRYWVPVWDVPDQRGRVQKVLQYPVTLAVVTPTYARFVGPQRGLSTTVLEGRGWAFGVKLAPAAGQPLLGGPVRGITDRYADLATVPLLRDLPGLLRAVMSEDPGDEAAHAAGRTLVEDRVARLGPLGPEDRLVNEVVRTVEEDGSVLTVTSLCERLGLSERSLQRLTSRRLGLSPLWLVRRRRLHEAADRLRQQVGSLADVAADLGYADQAHFSRDFRTATGYSPREFATLQRTGA